jgi:hypothetical protein
MSTEDLLDKMTQYFIGTIHWAVYKLPVSLMPYLLHTYTVLNTLYTNGSKQAFLTARACVESFENDNIIFYKYNSLYIPFISKRLEHVLLEGEYTWLYSVANVAFYNMNMIETDKTYHLPMLGASVSCMLNETDAVLVGDMSEWIQEQKIYNITDDIPFQVLVSAWAYVTKNKIQYDYKNYIITVMDLEGNEQSYCLQTETVLEKNINIFQSEEEYKYTMEKNTMQEEPTTEEVSDDLCTNEVVSEEDSSSNTEKLLLNKNA